MLLEGRVVGARSRSFRVETSTGLVQAIVLKGLRHQFPGQVDPVAVGDHVRVRVGEGVSATIEEVLERRNWLSRPAVGKAGTEQLIASNLARAVVVQAIAPPWKAATWDRYLVMCSAGKIPAALCLNKIDLDPGAAGAPELEAYRRLGIPLVLTSARSGQGIEDLAALLAQGPSVLIGPSGAGKSSLINALAPGSRLPTGALSRSTGKGRHTTTWVELLSLGHGIEVVDSPGLRVLGLWGVAASELESHFIEFAPWIDQCRFRGCAHVHEPGCAIKQAVDRGDIPAFRYESYCRIHETVRDDAGRETRSRRR